MSQKKMWKSAGRRSRNQAHRERRSKRRQPSFVCRQPEHLEDRRLLTLNFVGAAMFGGPGEQFGTGVASNGSDVYVSGTSDVNSGDGLVAQFSTALAPVWSKTWPSQLGSDSFRDVAVSSEGVYAFGDSFSRTTDVVGGKENKGITVKFPLAGPPGGGFDGAVWDRQTPAAPGAFGYGGSETLWGGTVTTEGGQVYAYATGSAQSGFSNGGRFHLNKLDANGNVLWSLTDGSEQVGNAYSAGADVATLNGFIYAAGRSDDDGSMRPQLRKYDANGNLVWTRKTAANFSFTGEYIAVTAAGNEVYTVGSRASGGTTDFLIEKWDESGTRLWSVQYDRGGSDDLLFGVATNGTQLFAVGRTDGMTAGGSDAIILELDPANGALLSSTLYGGAQADAASDVVLVGTDLYVVGETRSFAVGGNTIGQSDLLLLKYSTSAAVTTTTVSLTGNLLQITDDAGPSDDTLTIQSDTTNSQYIISDPNNILGTTIPGSTGNGTNTVTVPFGTIDSISFDTLGGDDTLTVDFSLGNFAVPLDYNGGTQNTSPNGDTLALTGGGPFALATYNFANANDGSIDIAGNGTITYTGLEPVSSMITATNVTLNYSTTAETLTVTDAGGGQTTVTSNVAAEMVTFNNPSGTLTINAGDTGDDIINISSLAANYPAAIVLDGEGGNDTVTLNVAGGLSLTDTLDIRAENITQSQPITGTGPVRLATSTALFSQSNSYTAGTTVSQGTLRVTHNNAVGTGTVTLGDAGSGSAAIRLIAAHSVGDLVIDEPITVSAMGTGTVTIGGEHTGGRAFFDGLVTLNRDVTLRGQLGNDRTQFRGGISGTGNVTIDGGHRVTWSTTTATTEDGDGPAPYDFDGDVAIINNTYLQLNSNFTSGASSLATKDFSIQGGAALRLAYDTDATIDELSGNGLVEAIAPSPFPDPSILTIGADDGSSTFNGRLTDAGRVLALIKTGSGTITLAGGAGSNTYTGLTHVQQGVLAVGGAFGGDGAIKGNITVENGATYRMLQDNVIVNNSLITLNGTGTLDRNGRSDVIGALAGNGQVTGGGTLIMDLVNNTQQTFSGTVTGGSLSVRGDNDNGTSASQILTGTSTGLGGLSVQRGDSANDVPLLVLAGSGSTTTGSVSVGQQGNAQGIATMNIQDMHTLNTGTFFLGESQFDAGFVNQTGGTVNASGQIRIAHWPDESSIYDISGGTLNSTDSLYVGWDGTGLFDVSGTADVNANLVVVQRGSNLQISDMATVDAANVSIGDVRGAGNVTQDAGDVTVSGLFRLAHYPVGTSTYTLNGGTLTLTGIPAGGTEQIGGIYVGVDGHGIFNHNDGTISTRFLWLDNRGASPGIDQYNMTGGTLALTNVIGIGSSNSGSMEINLGGGTIRVDTAFSNMSAPGTLTGTNGDTTFDTNGNAFAVSGALSGSGGLVKVGGGAMALTAANNYSGSTVIDGGALLVSGSTSASSPITVNVGGTLGGNGNAAGTVTVNGGTIAPGLSPGILSTGSVDMTAGGSFTVEIEGDDAGNGTGFHDQLAVTGTVDLGAGTAVLNLSGPYVPAAGDDFVILANDGVEDTLGFFTGLPEGSELTFNGETLYITYNGGDGNDVVLNTGPVVSGTNGNDTLEVTPLPGGDLQYQFLPGGPVVTLIAPPSFTFNGRGGDDVMIVQANGNTFAPISYNGGDQDFTNPPTPSNGDALHVIGGGQDATYTPSASATGSGVVDVSSGGTITFTGLEPVDVSGFGTVTLSPAGVDDVLTIANGVDSVSGTTQALVVSGTTGGVPIEALHAWNNTTLVVDTSANDGDDTVTVSSANNAHGNGSLVIQTGTGTDVTNVNGAINVADDATIDSVDITVVAGATIVAGFDLTLDAENELTIDGPLTATMNDVELYADNDDININASVTAGDDVIATAFLGDVLFTSGTIQADDDVDLDSDGVVDIDGPITAGGDIGIQTSFLDQGSVFVDADITADGEIAMIPDETDADVLIGSGAIITSDADMSGAEDLYIFADRDVVQNSGSLVSNTGALQVLTLSGDAVVISAFTNGVNQIGGTAAAANGAGDAALQIWPGGNAIVSGIVSTMGDVEVVSDFDDVVLGDIDAGANLVFLEATTGAIVDNNGPAGNVTAGGLAIEAVTGIGSGDALETAVGTLAASNTSSGNIELENSVGGLLTIGSVGLLDGITNGGGNVVVTNLSPLTVAADVTATGPITLTATDSGAGDDLTVNPGVTVNSTGSSVTLNAGDDALIDGDLSAATTVTINGDFGNNDAGIGSTVTINGVVTTGGGAFVNGNVDSDTFNLAAQSTTSFTIDGNSPVLPTLPGDTLNLDISGTSDPVLTLGTMQGSGTFTFDAPFQPVTFTSIETLDTAGTPYHLVLDMIASGFVAPSNTIQVQLNPAGTVLEIIINGNPFFQGQVADIRSFTVLGTNDVDDLQINETAGGLPSFVEAAPSSIVGSNGSHLNASAQYFLDTTFGGPFTVDDVSIHYDGRGGMDVLRLNLTTNHDVAHFADNLDTAGSGNLGANPVGGMPGFLMSFADLSEMFLAGTGAGSLLVDSSSLDVSQLTINAGANPSNGNTLINGDNGFTETSFDGFANVQVNSGNGDDLIDLQSLDVNGNIANIRINGNNVQGTDGGDDTLRIRATLPGVNAQAWGGAGNDLFQLFDAAPTVNNIGGPVSIDGQGGSDTLSVDDSAATGPDTISITETVIDGITGNVTPGPDIVYTAIDQLSVTATSGNDDVTIDMTTGGSDLDDAVINGAGGDDQLRLESFITDLATITINGNAGSDTFNEPTGPPNPNPNTDPRGKLEPSLTTLISVNGEAGPTGSGNPTSPPNGDTDTFNLDVTVLTAPVIVDTIAGIATSAGPHQNVNFSGMEALCLDDVTRDDVNINIGELYVRTTNDRERITFTSWNDGGVKLRIDNLDSGSSLTFPEHFGLAGGVQMLERIVTFAQDGNDLVSIAGHVVDAGLNPIPVEFHGEDGDDYLTGANGDDILVGGPGNDRVLGGEGNNQLFGDGNVLDQDGIPIELDTDGNDNVSGRSGNDIIFGGGGNDQLNGSSGNDYIHAGSGNDLVDGGLDDDVLVGAGGNDTLSGNYGNDILLGGAGIDQLFGRQGDDVLLGGSDADRVRGDAGNDLVVGGNASSVNDATTDAALRAILADWASNNPAVPAGLGTLLLDGVQDLLIGDQGADAFHESALPELLNEDRVYDYRAGDGDTLL